MLRKCLNQDSSSSVIETVEDKSSHGLEVCEQVQRSEDNIENPRQHLRSDAISYVSQKHSENCTYRHSLHEVHDNEAGYECDQVDKRLLAAVLRRDIRCVVGTGRAILKKEK